MADQIAQTSSHSSGGDGSDTSEATSSAAVVWARSRSPAVIAARTSASDQTATDRASRARLATEGLHGFPRSLRHHHMGVCRQGGI
jgi:hypothetical protein